MSSRQRGHEKQIVRNECLVRQGAGYGVNATEAATLIAAQVHRARMHEVNKRAEEVPMIQRRMSSVTWRRSSR